MPRALRFLGFAFIIIAALLRIQHWPGALYAGVGGACLLFVAILWRLASGAAQNKAALALDTFYFLLVVHQLLRAGHLPYRTVVLVLALLPLAYWSWWKFKQGANASFPQLLLNSAFVLSAILIVAGVLFKVQHWPYASVLLIGGLVIGGIWFLATLSKKEEGP